MTQALAKAKKAPRGLEDIGQEDLLIPKIILLQHNSNLVKKDGKKPGTFINGTTMKDYGKSLEFVPVKAQKYYDMLKQNGTRMVFEARTYDANDPRLKGRRFFRDGDIKANANSVMSFLCIIEGLPALIAFKVSGYKAGKKLASQAKMKGEDLFAFKYRLVFKSETGDDNDWYVMDVEEVGRATETEFKQAEQAYDAMAGRMKDIDAPSGAAAGTEAEHTEAPAKKEEGLGPDGAKEAPEKKETAETASSLEEEKPTDSPFTSVRVVTELKDDAAYACTACGKKRIVREGKLKTVDPASGKVWGKIKALVCQPCNKLDVIEKLAD